MNSENARNKIALSFIDLVNMLKELVGGNQQPSVTQELGRLFTSTRGRGRRGKSRELVRVDAGGSSTMI